MATKKLKIGFYKVAVRAKTQETFDSVLDRVSRLPDDESRAVEYLDGAFRLQFAKRSKSIWQGEMMRLRMNETPIKGNLKGKVEQIPLESDEGIGEQTAFLYDPSLDVLVYHEFRGGVTVRSAGRYFKDKGAVRAIEMAPILKPEVMERVAKMGRITEFIVHLAGVESGGNLRNKGESASALVKAASAFQAPKAQFRLKVGKNGSLAKVIEAARDFLDGQLVERDKVTKLVVVGSEMSEEAVDVVDLLADRLVEEIQVDMKENRISAVECHRAVREAWEFHRESLESTYGSKT